MVAVIQQHTQREKEALAVDGERGNNYTNNYAIIKFFLEIILEIICTLLNKRVNLYRGVFLYSLKKGNRPLSESYFYKLTILLTNKSKSL